MERPIPRLWPHVVALALWLVQLAICTVAVFRGYPHDASLVGLALLAGLTTIAAQTIDASTVVFVAVRRRCTLRALDGAIAALRTELARRDAASADARAAGTEG